MTYSTRRVYILVGLLLASSLIHAIVSWQVGRKIDGPERVPPPEEEVVQIVMEKPPEPELEKTPPPEEQLEFEEELEFDPPEILLAPKSVAPPPPDVTVALKAQSGGFQGIDVPTGIAAVPLSEGSGVGGFKTGIGNGLGDGTARFAAYIAGLREAGLDVVFAIDATGSMDWVIDEVRDRIQDIAQTVRSLVPIARFGVVAYRDYDDPEFTTKVHELTYSTAKIRRFMSQLEAKGGGDWFEAIDAGIKDAIEKSGWRIGARRLIIVVGDAPLKQGQLDKVIRLAAQFGRSGGTISTLDVSDQANPSLLEAKVGRKVARPLYRSAPMHSFLVIGEAGGGDAATLDGELKLTKRLVKLIMGDQFANEMQALLDAL